MSQSELSELLTELDPILAAQDAPAHEFVCDISFVLVFNFLFLFILNF